MNLAERAMSNAFLHLLAKIAANVFVWIGFAVIEAFHQLDQRVIRPFFTKHE